MVPASRARTMSPASSLAGSAGATVTSWRLRISGTIEEPLGRKSTVDPAATRPAIESKIPIGDSLRRSATPHHPISAPVPAVCGRCAHPDHAEAAAAPAGWRTRRAIPARSPWQCLVPYCDPAGGAVVAGRVDLCGLARTVPAEIWTSRGCGPAPLGGPRWAPRRIAYALAGPGGGTPGGAPVGDGPPAQVSVCGC